MVNLMDTTKTFTTLHFGVVKIVKCLICLFFLIFIFYGISKEYQIADYFNSTFISRRTVNNVSLNNEKSTTLSKQSFKKCFYLSSVKHKTTSISELLQELILRNTFTDTFTEEYAVNTWKKEENRHTFCNRFITVGEFQGRTGNQMFEIASLLGTAYTYDIIPLIPATYQITKYFDLPNLVKPGLNNLSNVVKCKTNKSAVYYNFTEQIKTGKNISLHGYLQSWKYFFEARFVIKTVFKFKQKYLDRARDFLSNISQKGDKRVCIHVRRGDISRSAMQKVGYVIGGVDFIEKARKFFKKKYSKVQFIVISDDKAWCRKHINGSNISSLNNPGEDLALMSLCDNVIFSSSTFGWWGAWLSGGTTIYFNKHPRPGSRLAARMSKEDFYPSDWIGLS